MWWVIALILALVLVALFFSVWFLVSKEQFNGTVVVRRNAKNLSPEEKAKFINVIRELKRKPSDWPEAQGLSVYDAFVLWHQRMYGSGHHAGPMFLPWHRMMLKAFEDEMLKIDPSVTLPYWDFTEDREPTSYVWQNEFMGGNGDLNDFGIVKTGPFGCSQDAGRTNVHSNFFPETPQRCIRRNLGTLSQALPTREEIQRAMAISTYDSPPWNEFSDPSRSFRNSIEGWMNCSSRVTNFPNCSGEQNIHNRVHRWIGGRTDGIFGTMFLDTSPNDPIFYLLHAYIDKIWEEWMNSHGRVYVPESGLNHGQNLNDEMHTIGSQAYTIRNVLNIRDLEYRYE